MVEHHGRIVPKSALIEAVWPNTAVGDNSLAQCLFDIRRVLGDDSQQFIRTVARRGYVFAAPVTTHTVELELPTPGVEDLRCSVPVSVAPRATRLPASPPCRPGRRLIGRIALLALGAALLGSFTWRMWRGRETPEPLQAMPLNSLPGGAPLSIVSARR
jgi:hypothetical protein